MFIRPKFITNSSSTCFFGWGVVLEERRLPLDDIDIEMLEIVGEDNNIPGIFLFRAWDAEEYFITLDGLGVRFDEWGTTNVDEVVRDYTSADKKILYQKISSIDFVANLIKKYNLTEKDFGWHLFISGH